MLKPTKQTKFGAPDGPQEDWGNCFPACIASILAVELDDVPHWIALHDGDELTAAQSCLEWLKERGVQMLAWQWDDFSPELHREFAGGLAILSGPAHQAPHWNHAVIGRLDGYGGWSLLHDPGRSGAGILEPMIVAFLIPLQTLH